MILRYEGTVNSNKCTYEKSAKSAQGMAVTVDIFTCDFGRRSLTRTLHQKFTKDNPRNFIKKMPLLNASPSSTQSPIHSSFMHHSCIIHVSLFYHSCIIHSSLTHHSLIIHSSFITHSSFIHHSFIIHSFTHSSFIHS